MYGPTGFNPLEGKFKGEGKKRVRGPDKAPRKKRRRSPAKAIKMFTAEQWAEMVEKVQEARNKGWSLTRCARNLNLSVYRVRQALGCIESSTGESVEPRLINLDEGATAAPRTASAKGNDRPDVREQAILDLLQAVPAMQNASAKFWLKHLSEML